LLLASCIKKCLLAQFCQRCLHVHVEGHISKTMRLRVPADAWHSIAGYAGISGLACARTCCKDEAADRVLKALLSKLETLNLSSLTVPLAPDALKAAFALCPAVRSIVGLHCQNLMSCPESELGGIISKKQTTANDDGGHAVRNLHGDGKRSRLPELPTRCRRLSLRFADTWSFESCVSFLSEMEAWVSESLHSLALAWNPQDYATEAMLFLDYVHPPRPSAIHWTDTWDLSALRSLNVHEVPSPLSARILTRALECGAKLRSVHLPDVPLPDASSPLWKHLTEFSLICRPHDDWRTSIDDALLLLLAQAAPPLRKLHLTDARSKESEPPLVSAAGLTAIRPLLSSITDLGLRRTRGALCKALDDEATMLLSGALSPALDRS